MTTAAIIVAAGSGSRFGGDIPKQYQLLGGKPILQYSLDTLAQQVDQVVVVTGAGHARWLQHIQFPENARQVVGGATRQASVLVGLQTLAAQSPQHVLIHDAARPFITTALIQRLLAAQQKHVAVLPVVAVADTLKSADNGLVAATVSRDGLYAAQTPQGFHFKKILAAHAQFQDVAATDDAALAEMAGMPVTMVEGEKRNFKITTAEDMIMANALLPQQIRIGQGFDVHAFGDGNHVTLCGVKIPHNQGLQGHSDADVALHALADALLGSMALGDIGVHFPPSDPQWRGADSRVFLRHAKDLLDARGAVIQNVDVTIIAEAPKILPHRAAMQAVLMADLGLALDQVSIKGTTTEGLGFTGRREGIAAQAVVLTRCV